MWGLCISRWFRKVVHKLCITLCANCGLTRRVVHDLCMMLCMTYTRPLTDLCPNPHIKKQSSAKVTRWQRFAKIPHFMMCLFLGVWGYSFCECCRTKSRQYNNVIWCTIVHFSCLCFSVVLGLFLFVPLILLVCLFLKSLCICLWCSQIHF